MNCKYNNITSTSSSSMVLQSSVDSNVFDLSFQFVISHLLISVCTQFHHLYFCRSLNWLPTGLLLNTWLSFLLLSILKHYQFIDYFVALHSVQSCSQALLLTKLNAIIKWNKISEGPIQFKQLILRNKKIYIYNHFHVLCMKYKHV
jgi:hypothetical protein